MYNTVAAAEASGNPARTWVLKTDADGWILFPTAEKVSGDDFYLDSNGRRVLPIGTLLIQETKAPVGYQLNGTVFLRQITDDGSNAEHVDTFNMPEIPETVSLGHLEITKAAEDGVKAGFRFRITGPSYPDGVVKTTDAAGKIRLESIRAGAYTVEEIDVPGRYLAPANNPRTVTVTFNATATTAYENKLVRGSVQLTKTDADTAQSGQGDASVAGIRFALVNESSYAVRYNDVDYATGEVVAILSLGADGTAATASKSLPYGDYTVYELRQDATIAAGESYEGSTKLGASELANDCYLFAENSKSVSVREDGQQVTAKKDGEFVRSKHGFAILFRFIFPPSARFLPRRSCVQRFGEKGQRAPRH